MGILFHNKWTSTEGSSAVNGKPSPGLLIWCEKLEGLTGEQIKTGIEALESKLEKSSHGDKELWPPSYAEFKGLCLPRQNDDGLRLEWRKEYRERDAMRLENITARDAQALRNKDHAKNLLRELRGDRKV
jgi:hypothetical protein